MNRFGCRPVMLAGGLLASLGMVAASFCRSIIELYLTTGVITGEWGPAGSRAGRGMLAPPWPGAVARGAGYWGSVPRAGLLRSRQLRTAPQPWHQSVPRSSLVSPSMSAGDGALDTHGVPSHGYLQTPTWNFGAENGGPVEGPGGLA